MSTLEQRIEREYRSYLTKAQRSQDLGYYTALTVNLIVAEVLGDLLGKSYDTVTAEFNGGDTSAP